MSAVVVRSREIVVGGIRSPVLESGPADAREAVLFVHGNPGSSRDWEDLVSRVGAFARAIAVDMPGFGQADKPDDFEYTVLGYAKHLDAMLGALGVDRVHLVLHDFGGPWGLAWAAQHLGALASLTLVNIGIMRGYRWHYMAVIWRTPVLGELAQLTATRAGFRLLLKHGNPRGLPRRHIDRMYDDYDRRTRRAVLRLYRSTQPNDAAASLAAALRLFSGPVLVVWGRHDPYVAVEYAEQQREVWPQAAVQLLDESGHWPMLDDPERTAAAIIPFLRRNLA